MAFRWDKEAHASWKDKVSFELIELRQAVTALQVQVHTLVTGTQEGPVRVRGTTRTGSDFTEITQFKFYKEEPLEKLEDIEAKELTKGDLGTELVKSTYAIKSATVAMRGYLMLLGQAGLSPDQKALVNQLAYLMMMIMKVTQAIRILVAVSAGTISPHIGIFLAGGYLAAGMAYSSKTMGGVV